MTIPESSASRMMTVKGAGELQPIRSSMVLDDLICLIMLSKYRFTVYKEEHKVNPSRVWGRKVREMRSLRESPTD